MSSTVIDTTTERIGAKSGSLLVWVMIGEVNRHLVAGHLVLKNVINARSWTTLCDSVTSSATN